MFQHHIAQLNRRYFDHAASKCVASSTIFILLFGLWLLLWILLDSHADEITPQLYSRSTL